MREDLVTPTMARRLIEEGFLWEPQPGDWVTTLGGAYLSGDSASGGMMGLWLVVTTHDREGYVTAVDGDGRWPQSRFNRNDCLWLPSAGKLKVWLRGRGYRIATGDSISQLLGGTGPTTVCVCRLTRDPAPGMLPPPPIDSQGINEAEAVAIAILKVLSADRADTSGHMTTFR